MIYRVVKNIRIHWRGSTEEKMFLKNLTQLNNATHNKKTWNSKSRNNATKVSKSIHIYKHTHGYHIRYLYICYVVFWKYFICSLQFISNSTRKNNAKHCLHGATKWNQGMHVYYLAISCFIIDFISTKRWTRITISAFFSKIDTKQLVLMAPYKVSIKYLTCR